MYNWYFAYRAKNKHVEFCNLDVPDTNFAGGTVVL